MGEHASSGLLQPLRFFGDGDGDGDGEGDGCGLGRVGGSLASGAADGDGDGDGRSTGALRTGSDAASDGAGDVGVRLGAGVAAATGAGVGGGGGCGQELVGSCLGRAVWTTPGAHHGAASKPLAGSTRTVTANLDGYGKGRTGLPARAAVMKDCQMRAGKVPPSTRETPCTSYIGRGRVWPTQTDAASCGVKPTNHASR